jgi:hypothetical protein
MRRVALIVLVVLILLAGAWVAAQVVVGPEVVASQTYGPPVDRVVVDIGSGTVHVRGGTVEGARVDRRVRIRVGTVEQRLEGGTLRIRVRCRLPFVPCRVRFDITVPPEADLHVESGAGRVAVSGLRGPVDVETGAGSIEVDGLSGRLRAESGAGSIRGRRLESEKVTAESGAGSIELTFTRPPTDVVAESGAGGIDLEVPDDSYRVLADSGAGTVANELGTDPASPRSITASTGAGSVRIRRAAD